MATPTSKTAETGQEIRELAARLRTHRQHPCLIFVSRSIQHSDVLAVRKALGDEAGDHLDLIVSSPGGDIEAAYLVVRELRRRFKKLVVFIPFRAKSAATLLCLAADELIMGSLGELGPLDQQYDEKQQADSPVSTSRLLLFKAFEQLRYGATEMYDTLVARISNKSGMRVFDACSKAAELTSALYGPIYGQIDPARLAESARGLEIAAEYAERLLKRYRAAFWAEQGSKILDRLIHGYPTHGFIIDQEEVQDLGIPTKIPDDQEAALLDRLAVALIEFGTEQDLIALAGLSRETIAAAQEVLNGIPEHAERTTPGSSNRRQRHGRKQSGKGERR
jgi:hypothetical protein